MARFPLQTLLEHSQHRMEAAERLLRMLKRREDEARRQLEQLQGFRAEYQVRLREAGEAGMGIQSLREYQAFLAKVELAVKRQEEEANLAHGRWEQAHQQWLAQRQKVKAYETLATRHHAREAHRVERREQKATDERAGRRYSEESNGSEDGLA